MAETDTLLIRTRRAALMLATALTLAACAAGEGRETVEVLVPVDRARLPPPAVTAPIDPPPADVPIFTGAEDPAAAVCLTLEGAAWLRQAVGHIRARSAGLKAWRGMVE